MRTSLIHHHHINNMIRHPATAMTMMMKMKRVRRKKKLNHQTVKECMSALNPAHGVTDHLHPTCAASRCRMCGHHGLDLCLGLQ